MRSFGVKRVGSAKGVHMWFLGVSYRFVRNGILLSIILAGLSRALDDWGYPWEAHMNELHSLFEWCFRSLLTCIREVVDVLLLRQEERGTRSLFTGYELDKEPEKLIWEFTVDVFHVLFQMIRLWYGGGVVLYTMLNSTTTYATTYAQRRLRSDSLWGTTVQGRDR